MTSILRPNGAPIQVSSDILSAEDFSTSAFSRWIGERKVPHLGTNSGASPLAFQTWHHFKEAFPPELIRQMFDESEGEIESCFDAFGGSGTTALASQFLGVSSTTIEVNPFLADVIGAKVTRYDSDLLAQDFGALRGRASKPELDAAQYFKQLPPTFLEPGVSERWIFDREVADSLAAVLWAIDQIEEEGHQRFFRVLVGGLLADVSNVVINGKGRRYRHDWKGRGRPSVLGEFSSRAQSAIADVHRFGDRPRVRAKVLLGDARKLHAKTAHDIAVISPPYPNSFDYTDIYNLELWMLGYLNGAEANRSLRAATLASHVQLQREFPESPSGSKTLKKTLKNLEKVKDELWSPWIPSMVGAYFADLIEVLAQIKLSLKPGARCCIVIGDSRYGGVLIPSAKVLSELSIEVGWEFHSSSPVRAMRSSAQQGGTTNLDETLLILVNSP